MLGTGPQGLERLQMSIVPGEISHSLGKGRGLTAAQPRTPPVSPTPAAPWTPRGPSALRAKQPLSSLPPEAAHGRPPAPGCLHPEPLKPPVYQASSEAHASPQREPRRPRARRQRVQPGGVGTAEPHGRRQPQPVTHPRGRGYGKRPSPGDRFPPDSMPPVPSPRPRSDLTAHSGEGGELRGWAWRRPEPLQPDHSLGRKWSNPWVGRRPHRPSRLSSIAAFLTQSCVYLKIYGIQIIPTDR